MKVVILAGGFGTRICEESYDKPKPMIPLGGIPIIVHIMNFYAAQGYKDFIVCGGYRHEVLDEYFKDFSKYNVQVVDTGLNTMTGGRIKRIKGYLPENEPFFMTYGDGVSNIDLCKLLAFHKKHKHLATMSAVKIQQRFGIIKLKKNGLVKEFKEKIEKDGPIINGGFMVLEPKIIDYIEGDSSSFERDTLEKVADMKQLDAYMHDGFWMCMDTLREKNELEDLWKKGNAPWKIWKD